VAALVAALVAEVRGEKAESDVNVELSTELCELSLYIDTGN
jgi:hypothetical protein